MITAVFHESDTARASGLWQYDYGQVLRIQGLSLPSAVEIDFSLQESGGESDPRIGVTHGGVTDVPIPDSMLENGGATQDYYIYAWVYLSDETSGETIKHIKMHVKSRSKPKAFSKPEDADLFREAIASVNKSAVDAQNAEKSAEAWAHGSEDYPDRDEDNAAYYAGVAGENAGSAHDSMVEAKRLASQVHSDADVTALNTALAEQYKSQAAQSAADALQSKQNAKASETAAQEARTGAETAEGQAELYAGQAAADKAAVELIKSGADKTAQKIAEDKNTVQGLVDGFSLNHQQAVADVNNAGQTQVERVNEAGETAVDNIEFSRKQATQSVTNEGATQVANVQAAAEEITGKVEQIDKNTQGITELNVDLDNSLGYNYYKIEPIWTNGAFYNRFAALISDTHASYTEIEVKASEKYHIIGYNAYLLSLYSLRDSNKNNVTTYPDASDKNYEKRKFDEYITIPEGVKYLCVSKWDSFGEMLVEKESYTRVSDIDTRVTDIDTVTIDTTTDFYQIGNDTIEVGWVRTNKNVENTDETSNSRHLTINNIIGGDTYRYTSIGGGDCHAVLWFDDTGNLISYVPFTNTWNRETVEVIAPTDAVKAIVNNINTSKCELVFEYFGLTRVVKANPIIEKKVSDIDTRLTELEDGTIDFFEYENIKKRVIENQIKNDFAWKEFDGLYATITFDDTNSDIDKLQNLAEEMGIPFCYATIPSKLNNTMSLGTETALQTLQRAVSNGGEVLAHWAPYLNSLSTDEDYYNCYIGVKKALVDAGFNIDGVIVAGGGSDGTPQSYKTQDWEKVQEICRIYYKYADLVSNDYNGIDTRHIEQFYNPRKFTDGGIESMKLYIDTMVSNSTGWLNMASHGTNHPNTPNIDAFREIFQYAINNGFTFVTWGEMYDKFKSSKLEERIKALELN